MEQHTVHMVMGKQEAAVIGTALGFLVSHVSMDIEKWENKSEKDLDEFLSALSVKFVAEGMFDSIMDMLGVE